jgi:hypothetical protein
MIWLSLSLAVTLEVTAMFSHVCGHQLLRSISLNMPNDKELSLSDMRLPFVILGDDEHLLLSCLLRLHSNGQLIEYPRIFN